ncbi:MAG: hypothetical protein DRQ62_13620 [Gammaproteobacteria bacterium]|nr:MAG: hypothetical protein DRQ62_13620 [Gammaproteobacteria bacterium]
MKTKITILTTLVLLLIFMSTLHAQDPTLLWANQMGGPGADVGRSITTDTDGNVYTTGYFREIVDFDPGAGTTILTSVGDYDIFIQKLDNNGNFIWVKQMGGTSSDKGFSIATDANGNIYTTGQFLNTVDFDPGAGTFNLTSAGSSDIFVLKLDNNGDFIWAKQMGGTIDDMGLALAVDNNGNVYTTGFFLNTVDFDPGAGIANLSSVGGSRDMFIQKLDTSGNFIWVKQMGGSGDDGGLSIATDADGNIYSTGNFESTVDFDPGAGITNLTSAGNQDGFIQKLDNSGNLIWVRQIGGISWDWGRSLTTDTDGNVYTLGYFNETVDFDPGADITNFTSAGESDIFIQKLDTNGDLIWARQMGGPNSDYGFSIATDANGNVYTTGWFEYTVDFDPGVDTTNLVSNGYIDIYLQKLNADGIFDWAYGIGGTGPDYGYSITTDNDGNIFSTGEFRGLADFDPGADTTNFTAAGPSDIFVQKLTSITVGLLENTSSEHFVVYPNPTDGKLSIEFDNIQGSLTARLFSLTGQLIMNRNFQNMNSFQLEINVPSGMYILEVIDGKGKKAAIRILKE